MAWPEPVQGLSDLVFPRISPSSAPRIWVKSACFMQQNYASRTEFYFWWKLEFITKFIPKYILPILLPEFILK